MKTLAKYSANQEGSFQDYKLLVALSGQYYFFQDKSDPCRIILTEKCHYMGYIVNPPHPRFPRDLPAMGVNGEE
jgi:hypothetical protein